MTIRSAGSEIVIIASYVLEGPGGPGALVFSRGLATTLDTAVADAYIAAGFGAVDPTSGAYTVGVPRGTSLRDAAVAPAGGDYKPPVGGVAPGLSTVGEVA